MDEHLIEPDAARQMLFQIFRSCKMPENDAQYAADCMVQTNLWGVDSHGILRAPIYVKRLRNGAVTAAPDVSLVAGDENCALQVLDGDAGLGYVVARAGMTRAVDLARRFGTATVLVRNSNHFGAAALFTRLASDAGMIGVAGTNVMPNIGVKGNRKPVVGNNPVAMAAPLGGDFPFSLDISMSAVSGGKLLLARKNGEKIPRDWAVTSDGEETDDPGAGFAGFLLAMGMHKGLGLAFFADIMAGVASGGAFGTDLRSMYAHDEAPSGTAHFFYVLDPGRLIGKDEFIRRMKRWAEMVRRTPMRDGTTQKIPGEIEHITEQQRKEEGIPLPMELIEELRSLCAEAGTEFPKDKLHRKERTV